MSNSFNCNSSKVKVLILAVVAFNKGVVKRNVASPSIHSNTSVSNSTTFKVSALISSALRFNTSNVPVEIRNTFVPPTK